MNDVVVKVEVVGVEVLDVEVLNVEVGRVGRVESATVPLLSMQVIGLG